MEKVYVLYGEEACAMYDKGFEMLLHTKNVEFIIEKYPIEDSTHSKIINKTRKWKASRELTLVQYGMLLKKYDDLIRIKTNKT